MFFSINTYLRSQSAHLTIAFSRYCSNSLSIGVSSSSTSLLYVGRLLLIILSGELIIGLSGDFSCGSTGDEDCCWSTNGCWRFRRRWISGILPPGDLFLIELIEYWFY